MDLEILWQFSKSIPLGISETYKSNLIIILGFYNRSSSQR